MNLIEFKEKLSDVLKKSSSIGCTYQVFTNNNGKSGKNEILLFQNEYTASGLAQFHYIFVEIEGVMYFKRTEPSKLTWKKTSKTHVHGSERFVLDLSNTVEKFLESSISTSVVSEIKLPKLIEREVKTSPIPTIRPDHYGGEANPFEVRKIIAHYDLGFNLGNVIKYTLRGGKKKNVSLQEDLKKALTYLTFEIEKLDEKS